MVADPLKTPRVWYRQPYVWMLVAIPAASVVMGVVMVTLSIVSYDGLVVDDYYKRGLEINRVLDRDRAAQRMGLAGDLRLDATGTRLLLDAAAGGFRTPARVGLQLSYATRAGLDREISLSPISAVDYAGPVLRLQPGRWYLQAFADDWRITGTMMVPGSPRVRLAPDVVPER